MIKNDINSKSAGMIEVFGILPIPNSERLSKSKDIFVIFFNICINPGAILRSGLSVVAGLSFMQAVGVQVLGTLCGAFFCLIMAGIGCDYGVPGQVATRSAFGVRGSKIWCSLTRVLSSVYNFSFQNIVGCLSIHELIKTYFKYDLHFSIIIAIFGVVQVFVGVVGYDLLKKLSFIFTPLKLAAMAYLAWNILHLSPSGAVKTAPTLNFTVSCLLLLVTWVDVYLSVWLTLIPDAADFTRHSNNKKIIRISILLSVLCGSFIASSFGALGPVLLDQNNSNTIGLSLLGSPGIITLFSVFFLVFADNLTINALNIYTSGLSLCNVFSFLSRFQATILFGFLGISFSFLGDMLNDVVFFHKCIGSVVAPVSGVLLVDYLFIRKQFLSIDDLYKNLGPYWFTRGFNIIAMLWVFLGITFSISFPNLPFLPLVCIVLIGAGYAITWKTFPSYWFKS